jgi:hypothetical protein
MVMKKKKRWTLVEGDRCKVGEPDADVYEVLKRMISLTPDNAVFNSGDLFIQGIPSTPARGIPITELLKMKGLTIDRAHFSGKKWQITDGKGYSEDTGNGYKPDPVF